MDTPTPEGEAPPSDAAPLSVEQVLALWAPLIDPVKDTTGPLSGDPAASCIRDLTRALVHLDQKHTLSLQACSIYHYLFGVLAEAVESDNVDLAKTITQDMQRNAKGELPPFGLDRDGTVRATSWVVAILAQAMHDFMDALPAPNSAEWQLRYGDRTLVMSAQWKHGKTPMDCRREALAALQKSEEAVQNLRGALAVARTTFDVLAEDEGGLPSQAWDGYACVRAALGDPVRPEDRPRPTMTSTWVVGGPPTDVQLLTGLCWLVDAMRQWASAEGGDGMHDEARPAYDAARAVVDEALGRSARRQAGLPLPPPTPTADLRALVEGCVQAMNRWGHDVDGVHPVAWAAYKHGRALLGDPVHVRPRAEADAIVDALVAGLPPLYRTPARVDVARREFALHFPRGVWIHVAKGLGDSDPEHHAVCVSTEHHDTLAGPDPVYFVQGTTPNDPYPADGSRNLISIEGAVDYLTQRLTEAVPALPLAPAG